VAFSLLPHGLFATIRDGADLIDVEPYRKTRDGGRELRS
jgi:hypothetical protein